MKRGGSVDEGGPVMLTCLPCKMNGWEIVMCLSLRCLFLFLFFSKNQRRSCLKKHFDFK